MEPIVAKPSGKIEASKALESSMKERQLMLEEEMSLLSNS